MLLRVYCSRLSRSRSLMFLAQWLSMLVLLPVSVQAAELHLGTRSEFLHPGQGHEVHLSGPTITIARDGVVLIGWIAHKEQGNHL
jgi:hypothetical protein